MSDCQPAKTGESHPFLLRDLVRWAEVNGLASAAVDPSFDLTRHGILITLDSPWPPLGGELPNAFRFPSNTLTDWQKAIFYNVILTYTGPDPSKEPAFGKLRSLIWAGGFEIEPIRVRKVIGLWCVKRGLGHEAALKLPVATLFEPPPEAPPPTESPPLSNRPLQNHLSSALPNPHGTPRPLRVTQDVQRVCSALHAMLRVWESEPVRWVELAPAWDQFRAAFCDPMALADPALGYSVDGRGMPDGNGLALLIRDSTGITPEARDALGDVAAERSGGRCACMLLPDETDETYRERLLERLPDFAPVRRMRRILREAIQSLGNPVPPSYPATPPAAVRSGATGEGGLPAEPLKRKRQNPAGRKRLTRSSKPKQQAKWNVYELIRKAKETNPGWGKQALHRHFKTDKQFRELVTTAGLEFAPKMFHAALLWIKSNTPGQESRAGQETRSSSDS